MPSPFWEERMRQFDISFESEIEKQTDCQIENEKERKEEGMIF